MAALQHPRVRVVVIDDDDVLRQVLLEALATEDALVVVGDAGTGRDGLALVEELDPDVVLLDRRLPDGDGLDVLHAIKARPRSPEVVMLTGYADAATEKGAGRRGAYAFLVKPCPTSLLTDAVLRAARFDNRA